MQANGLSQRIHLRRREQLPFEVIAAVVWIIEVHKKPAVLDTLNVAVARPRTPEWTHVEDALGTQLNQALVDKGSKGAKYYLDAAAQQAKQILQQYVVRHQWPGWVLQKLANPLAKRVLAVLQEAPGPVLLAELPGRLAGSDPLFAVVARAA